MTGELRTVQIQDRIGHIYDNSTQCREGKNGTDRRPLPVFYWGIGEDGRDSVLAAASCVERLLPGAAFVLAAYESDNWNDDFSPWAAPAVFGREGFGGKAGDTLEWLTAFYMPYVEKGLSEPVRFSLGYSLAGLFGLWAYCESALFSGAVSCSGSLWYDGWLDYVREKAAECRDQAAYLYLSLGDREERTKNRRMAAVGGNTKAVYTLLCVNQENVQGIFEWNQGGHFSEPDLRISKGIYWILKHFDV
ncbi:MAG: alpha/beta hydrolase [Lachnospiraceae bacterium]|nr:alpha/beta hydrolase [Lachnospiraceae bacterium]